MTTHERMTLLGARINRLAGIWRRGGWWRDSRGRWRQQRLTVAQLSRVLDGVRAELREETPDGG